MMSFIHHLNTHAVILIPRNTAVCFGAPAHLYFEGFWTWKASWMDSEVSRMICAPCTSSHCLQIVVYWCIIHALRLSPCSASITLSASISDDGVWRLTIVSCSLIPCINLSLSGDVITKSCIKFTKVNAPPSLPFVAHPRLFGWAQDNQARTEVIWQKATSLDGALVCKRHLVDIFCHIRHVAARVAKMVVGWSETQFWGNWRSNGGQRWHHSKEWWWFPTGSPL